MTVNSDTKKTARHKSGKGCKGHLFIISAPSGGGKTTLCNMIRKRFPDMRYSVSYTTRLPRPGEKDGVDYCFISPAQFEAKTQKNEWVEWARVHDHFYGTSSAQIDKNLNKGIDMLLDIDVQGARQLLDKYPDSVTIFIMPPSMSELEKRLSGRGDTDPEVLKKRLKNAQTEMAQKSMYKYIIINDRLEKAKQELFAIIETYRSG